MPWSRWWRNIYPMRHRAGKRLQLYTSTRVGSWSSRIMMMWGGTGLRSAPTCSRSRLGTQVIPRGIWSWCHRSWFLNEFWRKNTPLQRCSLAQFLSELLAWINRTNRARYFTHRVIHDKKMSLFFKLGSSMPACNNKRAPSFRRLNLHKRA